jgi:hypothetical protein
MAMQASRVAALVERRCDWHAGPVHGHPGDHLDDCAPNGCRIFATMTGRRPATFFT